MIDEHVLDELDSSTQGMNPHAVEFIGLHPCELMAGDDIIKKAATKKIRAYAFTGSSSLSGFQSWMASTEANQRVGMKPQFKQNKKH